jgi:hypothetical protein
MMCVSPGGMYTDVISKFSYIDIIMESKIYSTLDIEFYSLFFFFFKALWNIDLFHSGLFRTERMVVIWIYLPESRDTDWKQVFQN